MCDDRYWEWYATIDHVDAHASGGAHDQANFVSTSMRNNNKKGNRTASAMGWTLRPKGDVRNWDGHMSDFISAVDADPALRRHRFVRDWYRAAITNRPPGAASPRACGRGS